jgi:hypothetical protein
VPETEALLPRFRAAHTQVLGVSVDSVYSHANWGASLGGVSFPLLSDFQPRGALAEALGCFIAPAGITDRATVIIDKDGVVQYAEAVGPEGQRDIAALAAECEKVDAANAGQDLPSGSGLAPNTVLFVRSNCGASRAATAARTNLHLEGVTLRNVSDDASAAADLDKASGGTQAPCLIEDGEALLESEKIITRLAEGTAPIR